MPTNQQIQYNKRKQQFLNQNGVKVKVDGSWGPWQESQYKRLTTKNKNYQATPLGFLSYLYDKTLGKGTTYQEIPFSVKGYNGEVKKDTRSKFRRNLDYQMQHNNTPLGYIAQTVAPTAAVSGAMVYGGSSLLRGGKYIKDIITTPFSKQLLVDNIKNTITNPNTYKEIAKSIGSGIAGGTAVNAVSELATGKTWGENMAQSTGMSADLGEWTNPGFGARQYYKYIDGVERRAIETAMRSTTNNPNPLDNIEVGFREMNKGRGGGKQRLFHIGNYILTGTRTGPKGYYNSMLYYKPSNNDSFINIEGKVPYYYSGILGRVRNGDVDMVDASLYNKTLDPKFGLFKVETKDYGPHNEYVKQKYPGRNIQVYKSVWPDIADHQQITNKSNWMSSSQDINSAQMLSGRFGHSNSFVDTGGFILQKGVNKSTNETMMQGQDIWKFNPDEYLNRYTKRFSTINPKNKLTKFGLKMVDKKVDPIITKTGWIY